MAEPRHSLRDALVGGLIGAVLTTAVLGVFAYWNYQVNAAQYELNLSQAQRQAAIEKDRADKERRRADELQKLIKGAGDAYIASVEKVLGDLQQELNRKEGPSQLVQIARDLLAARQAFRESLDSVGQKLNGELDRIQLLFDNPQPDEQSLKTALINFQRAWPAKKAGLKQAVDQLLVKLGVTI